MSTSILTFGKLLRNCCKWQSNVIQLSALACKCRKKWFGMVNVRRITCKQCVAYGCKSSLFDTITTYKCVRDSVPWLRGLSVGFQSWATTAGMNLNSTQTIFSDALLFCYLWYVICFLCLSKISHLQVLIIFYWTVKLTGLWVFCRF